MWRMRHMRQQLVAHGPVAGMPAAVVGLVIEQHQLTENALRRRSGFISSQSS